MECNFENCGYYVDEECTICGMGTDGEDTFCKYCKDNPNCYYKQLAKLKAENVELKKRNDKIIVGYIKLSEKYKQYKQTLQEIKAIAEGCITKDTCYDCKYCDDCYIEDAEIPTYDVCKLIIQKITKAESEDNQ